MTKPRIEVGPLLRSYSRKLLHDYQEGTKALSLSFDRGPGREKAVRDFFRDRIPGRYGVGEGFVIDASGGQSKQSDIVIYDRNLTPNLSTESALNIWTFETVYAVMEVKSTLTKEALQDAVENLATFKQLSRERNNLAGGAGFKVYAGYMNSPLGFLIAHQVDDSVAPGSEAFQSVVNSVPTEHRIDAYCVISGPIGCRGRREEGRTLLDVEEPELLHDDDGEGALATFLFVVISLLNGIQLGEPSLLQYLQFLTDG